MGKRMEWSPIEFNSPPLTTIPWWPPPLAGPLPMAARPTSLTTTTSARRSGCPSTRARGTTRLSSLAFKGAVGCNANRPVERGRHLFAAVGPPGRSHPFRPPRRTTAHVPPTLAAPQLHPWAVRRCSAQAEMGHAWGSLAQSDRAPSRHALSHAHAAPAFSSPPELAVACVQNKGTAAADARVGRTRQGTSCITDVAQAVPSWHHARRGFGALDSLTKATGVECLMRAVRF